MLVLVRIVHSIFGLISLASIAVIYYCGIVGEPHPLLLPACIAILLEGLAMVVSGFRCPLEPFHRKYGDDKGFFGLFLPKALVPYAVPFLSVATVIGFLLLLRIE
ncbi:MAG: hypothetical protein FJ217_01005 [Ignavibacteria bacterium]|nr:hypothetical protein [Ignavibacteria bacterium]